MRFTVEIDDAILAEAVALTPELRTKRELIEFALTELTRARVLRALAGRQGTETTLVMPPRRRATSKR